MNLLKNDLIRVRLTHGGTRALSLPQVLEALAQDKVVSFPALMAHQRQAWYSFLVQLASLAFLSGKTAVLPDTADAWREALLGLSKEGDGVAAWTLVVEDVTLPAFMQPPIPERSLAGFQEPSFFPDDLDILVTSKSHDVKMTRIWRAEPDHWVFALVTLQTLQGYLGQGNYGISRMKDSNASRPFVGLVPGPSWGVRFVRDVPVLTKAHDAIARKHGFKASGGKKLLWLYAWDGENAFDIKELDPYYIEICRRVRLRAVDGRIAVYRKPTKSPRVASKDYRGNLGDPWAPVAQPSGEAFNASKRGFAYARLQEILFSPQYVPGVAQEIHDADPEEGLAILATALGRSQGRTEGLHERVLPIPKEARRLISLAQGRDQLAQRSKERIEDVKRLEKKAFRPALASLLQGGKDDLSLQDGRLTPWVEAFDRRVDEIFFPHLWRTVSLSDEEARHAWQQELIRAARDVLHEAEVSVPMRGARRYRALAASENRFASAVAKCFPALRGRKERSMNTSVPPEAKGLAQIVESLATDIRKGRLGPGELAQLRRLRPEAPDQPAFWRILSEWISPGTFLPQDVEYRWAITLTGLARLASIGHDRTRPLGTALAQAGYSEGRLMRLLRTDGPRFADLVRQACAFLASRGNPVDWGSLAAFVLTTDPEKAEDFRRRVARDYYRELYRNDKGRNPL